MSNTPSPDPAPCPTGGRCTDADPPCADCLDWRADLPPPMVEVQRLRAENERLRARERSWLRALAWAAHDGDDPQLCQHCEGDIIAAATGSTPRASEPWEPRCASYAARAALAGE